MTWNILTDNDDRAVSPVIGVILMVAVTVILAAVVSMLVLGMGSDVESHPQASFSFDYDSSADTVDVTHEGGDTLANSSVKVLVNGDEDTDDAWPNAEISAGDTYTVGSGTAVSSGDSIRVVWTGSNGDTAVLGSFEVP